MNTDTKDTNNIRVMLADDSAVIRGLLTKTLEADPNIRIVSAVADGAKAVESVSSMKPDVMLLDIEMPVMDGLTALPKILELSPDTKIIMVSSLTEKGATVTLKALSLGATDCIAKPSMTDNPEALNEFKAQLIRTIKGIAPKRAEKETVQPSANAPNSATLAQPKQATTSFTLANNTAAYKGKPDVIAIGSSTGGPNALFEVTKHMIGFDIPILITQHMPATFTKILAQHITTHSGIPACEGEEGMVIQNGHIYVAPGGQHMTFSEKGGKLICHLDDGPDENFCKPSVEPMVRSLIDIYGEKVLGVILTGMGHDGKSSMQALTEKNGRMIAQDEATSVVWGMPGAVAQAGICSEVLPINQIGPWIKKTVLGM